MAVISIPCQSHSYCVATAESRERFVYCSYHLDYYLNAFVLLINNHPMAACNWVLWYKILTDVYSHYFIGAIHNMLIIYIRYCLGPVHIGNIFPDDYGRVRFYRRHNVNALCRPYSSSPHPSLMYLPYLSEKWSLIQLHKELLRLSLVR